MQVIEMKQFEINIGMDQRKVKDFKWEDINNL